MPATYTFVQGQVRTKSPRILRHHLPEMTRWESWHTLVMWRECFQNCQQKCPQWVCLSERQRFEMSDLVPLDGGKDSKNLMFWLFFICFFNKFIFFFLLFKLEQIAIERSASKSWSLFSSNTSAASVNHQHHCISRISASAGLVHNQNQQD